MEALINNDYSPYRLFQSIYEYLFPPVSRSRFLLDKLVEGETVHATLTEFLEKRQSEDGRGTTIETLTDFFSSSLNLDVNIPFMSIVTHHRLRFTDYSKRKLFYCGRHEFRNIFYIILKGFAGRKQKIDLVGTIGSGKSHLIAAVAVVLWCIKKSFVNNRQDEIVFQGSTLQLKNLNIVYIASCTRLLVGGGAYFLMTEALLLTFPNDKYLRELIEEYSNLKSKNAVSLEFLKNELLWYTNIHIRPHSILFLYDEWEDANEEEDTPYQLEIKHFLLRLASRHCMVISKSATTTKASSILYPSSRKVFKNTDQVLQLVGGLNETDWLAWLQIPRYQPFLQTLTVEECQYLQYYTGAVPLFFHDLIMTSTDNSGDVVTKKNLFEAIEHFEIDGGRCIHNELENFQYKIVPIYMNAYVHMMSKVILGPKGKCYCENATLFDHRFFYIKHCIDDNNENNNGYYVVPISGQIAKVMYNLLMKNEIYLPRKQQYNKDCYYSSSTIVEQNDYWLRLFQQQHEQKMRTILSNNIENDNDKSSSGLKRVREEEEKEISPPPLPSRKSLSKKKKTKITF